jgi:tetratricopeptide (TPR) repeat protein
MGSFSAHAQRLDSSEVETARHHYEAAVSYYEQLRYEDAAREFREAYRISGRSHLLKNIATSLQHARRWAEAADAYAQYLAEAPNERDREGIEARISRLRELAAGQARGDETREERVPETLPLESEDADSIEERPSTDTESSFPVVPTIFVSTAAALGIGALVTGLIAHDTYGRLDAACTNGICDPSLRGDRDQGEALAITSTVLTGACAVTAVTGIILFIVSGGESSDSEPSVSGYLDRDGGGLFIRGRM